MLKKVSIKLRLTILSMLLLTICCVLLTLTLNFSANQMANTIEATPVFPADEKDENNLPLESDSVPMETAPTEAADSQQARTLFLYQSIAYMVAVVLVGGGLTYYISGKALQPLYDFNCQIKKRTEHNLSEQLPVPESHDEIADLTCSFNEMSYKLNEAFSAQKRFAQSAAHELRTPLTVVKTKIDVFGKKPVHTAEEYDNLLGSITRHTDKHNVPNGQVSVLVSNNAGQTVITIADTGIGIPVNLQGHIFEPFFRVDKSRSRQMGGAGLGLATVKSIIDKHGGEITVSDNRGGGTVFTTVL